jgi:carboxymethylenebutenolidase
MFSFGVQKNKRATGETFMKRQDLLIEETSVRTAEAIESTDLGALFDGHIAREFADRDLEGTLQTMVPEPYVHCVPIMTGGAGSRGVRQFYGEHFLTQIPKDAQVTPISRTVGKDQVVDEFIVSFTHDTQWDYLLPGIPPTGNRVELPHVVVMKFENGKVAHEHLYWDQASLLVQVGLLDPANLPVAGVEQARRLRSIAEGSRDKNE